MGSAIVIVCHAASTNFVLNQLASVGTHIYSSGVTNASVMTNSAAGEVGDRTNIWFGSNTPVSTITTNTVNVLAADQYLRHIKSSQTFTRIADGPIGVNAYIAKSAGAGTTSIKPQFYWLLNSTQMVEFASATAQTITGATPTRYEWSVSVNSTNLPAASPIVWAWKVVSPGSASPALDFVSGGAYDSHATLVHNIASAIIDGSQVTGTVPAATNAINATNFWGVLSSTNLPATFNITPLSRNFVRSSLNRRAFLLPILLTAAFDFSS